MYIISKWANKEIHIEGISIPSPIIEGSKVILYNYEGNKEIDFIEKLKEMANKETIYILTLKEMADFVSSAILEE